MIAIHPEATDDPQTLRWVMPVGTLDGIGAVRAAPGGFGALLGGVVAAAVVEPAAVAVTLAACAGWREYGAGVRDALGEALTRPGEWRTSGGADPDTRLRAVAEHVLAGEVGDYVRSHGGSIEVVSARDGDLEVLLRGTCAGCPAAGITLHERIETEVRRLHPALRSLSAHEEQQDRRPLWATIRRR